MRIGIYEKGLPPRSDWPARMAAASEFGFDFIEIAVDETEERLSRLNWPNARQREFCAAASDAGIFVNNLILSAHRRTPLGSKDAQTRQKAIDILYRAIDFCVATGIRMIQLPGYYVFYEDRDSGSGQRFRDGLEQGVAFASSAGVMLALENMDGEDITSVRQAMHFVREIKSPWLQAYPDVGNLAGNRLDVCSELREAEGHLVGIHLKDADIGVFRRVPFGAGVVPFTAAFRTLSNIGYSGNFLIEMWNDENPNAGTVIQQALAFVRSRMAEAGLIVMEDA